MTASKPEQTRVPTPKRSRPPGLSERSATWGWNRRSTLRPTRGLTVPQGQLRRLVAATCRIEQIRGEEDIDGRLDIYALGCILFAAWSNGHVPFDGPDFATDLRSALWRPSRRGSTCIVARLPPSERTRPIWSIRCWTKDRDDRPFDRSMPRWPRATGRARGLPAGPRTDSYFRRRLEQGRAASTLRSGSMPPGTASRSERDRHAGKRDGGCLWQPADKPPVSTSPACCCGCLFSVPLRRMAPAFSAPQQPMTRESGFAANPWGVQSRCRCDRPASSLSRRSLPRIDRFAVVRKSARHSRYRIPWPR